MYAIRSYYAEDGTGIVHTAPTFGADDAMVAKQAVPEVPPMLVKDENGNLVPLVDLQGRFRPEMAEYACKYVKNEYYDRITSYNVCYTKLLRLCFTP